MIRWRRRPKHKHDLAAAKARAEAEARLRAVKRMTRMVEQMAESLADLPDDEFATRVARAFERRQ